MYEHYEEPVVSIDIDYIFTPVHVVDSDEQLRPSPCPLMAQNKLG
jgi:hypothetical protein